MPQSESSNPDLPIRLPRIFDLILTGTALLWAIASGTVADRSASGVTMRLGLYLFHPLLTELFLLFLILVGFWLLDAISTRTASFSDILTLPRRSGFSREWSIGAAAGWAMAIAAVLPVLLTGHLHGHLTVAGKPFVLIPLGLLTLAVVTLVEELVFRGYPFRRLTEAIGPSWASIVLALLFAVVTVHNNAPDRVATALLVEFAFGLLLAMAYLRTHALWLPWGLHFAYRAIAGFALGLPIAVRPDFVSLLDTSATGPAWLTGGPFGLDAALLTVPVMIAGFALVFRLTRWYAWEYTHAPIVSGGYEVTVAPPKAHVDMERQALAAPPPLVQILSSTSQTFSATPPPPRPQNDSPIE